MAENGEATTEAGAATAPKPPQMKILAQYIRDLSFENIVTQKGITGEVNPDIKVQVGLDAKKRSVDNQYELSVKFTITSVNKGTENTLFALELDYGAVFHIENVPDEQMHPFLMIECPRMLFPFIRRIVSDVTRDGGYPALNLENIDFVQIYRNELARLQAAQAAGGDQNGNADS